MPIGQDDPSLEHLKLSHLRNVAPTDDGELVLSFYQLRMSHQPMAAALNLGGHFPSYMYDEHGIKMYGVLTRRVVDC